MRFQLIDIYKGNYQKRKCYGVALSCTIKGRLVWRRTFLANVTLTISYNFGYENPVGSYCR